MVEQSEGFKRPGGLTLQESVATCLSKYADFSGRASRSEYWWFFLTVFLASAITGAISDVLQLIVGLGLFLPQLAVAVRRLHDTGKSGLWLFIGFIPLVGAIILIIWLATSGDRRPNAYGAPITN